MPETEGDFAVVGRSSCGASLLLFFSSSSSSAISINLLLRSESVEDDVEPVAVCNEHAADSSVSLSSLAVVIGNTIS